ncbi:hypothetical protein NA56DRAFT_296054 [Hyaloscypha hepaticicola]|uniref:Uncharacterized protein n=1 Tax=Hyaloscypha hepaticicola TaxID=2082293 RepID=A0A2J6QKF1_9HELO|nr:hypothetical protein NA56DRAFT_296054 [Hyaloscypha hepaticicola]
MLDRRVLYDSPLAIIKLIVSGGCVEWRLFANAKELPLARETRMQYMTVILALEACCSVSHIL